MESLSDLQSLLQRAEVAKHKRLKKQKLNWYHENKDRFKTQRKIYKAKAQLAKKMSELQKPFLGVDGEGAGEGESHIYWLLRVGDKALYHKDGSELQSIEILKWLADLGAARINQEFIPVAYFFDYDTTMILRHLPLKNLKELMYDKPFCVRSTCQHSVDQHVKRYSNCSVLGCDCRRYIRGGETTVFLDESNKNYLRIRLQHRQLKVAWPDSPFFVVTDTADLFQTSFVKTLEKWQIGENEEEMLCDYETLERIRLNKDRRGSFEIGYDHETFEYNKLECELLASLMTRFRNMCYAHGIFPDMWTGPGRLAEALFKKEGVAKRIEVDIPPIIQILSDIAYFGGRAEGIQFGLHKDVISYDIASAYPHAYTKLPCLLKDHGKWEEVEFDEVQKDNLEHTIVVANVIAITEPFNSPPVICGLPMRDTKGNISFPTHAYGAWWYPEVRDTIKLYETEGIKYTINIERCFTWRQTCEDIPGAFTERWFNKRVEVGKSTRGIPIKLTLNSLYGKAAQKVGAATWGNTVWAGLLTAYTRSRLLQATIAIGSGNIISYQTDGLFCTKDALEVGGLNGSPIKLGEWELEKYKELFLIQSGVYSVTDYEGKVTNKTRGMRSFEFTAAYDDIKKAWDEDKWFGSFILPKRNTFVTLKLAIMWNKPHMAGTWLHSTRKISFSTNMLKREIWGPDYKPTTDGTTFAPGYLHTKQLKIKYGPHPFNNAFAKVGLEPVIDKFSVPYSAELAKALYELNKEETTSYSYISNDEPYLLGE